MKRKRVWCFAFRWRQDRPMQTIEVHADSWFAARAYVLRVITETYARLASPDEVAGEEVTNADLSTATRVGKSPVANRTMRELAFIELQRARKDHLSVKEDAPRHR